MAFTIRAKVSTDPAEELDKNVNINGEEPYFTILTDYENAINLNGGTASVMKKLENQAGMGRK